jgi:hypothetical protein
MDLCGLSFLKVEILSQKSKTAPRFLLEAACYYSLFPLRSYGTKIDMFHPE